MRWYVSLPLAIATFPSRLFSRALLAGVRSVLDAIIQHGIDKRIDAADEEAGDARHLLEIAAALCQIFQTRDISLGDLYINFLSEQQRHVDVDAFADQLLDRGKSFGCSRDFDHHVLALHGLPQPPRFVDRLLGLARKVWRDFEADIAVAEI